jgi:hypothetical protein
LALVTALGAVVIAAILIHVHGIPTPGDISDALSHHPQTYTLSLGHMQDLTIDSLAYLRLPLVVAGIALLYAAPLAMVRFDPYLSSRPLATVLENEPAGVIIAQGFYYQFSSVFFYLNRTGLLLSARRANLEYGSHVPAAPEVFLVDSQLPDLWSRPQRYYLLTFASGLPHYQSLLPGAELDVVAASGRKLILTNHPLTASARPPSPASAPLN